MGLEAAEGRGDYASVLGLSTRLFTSMRQDPGSSSSAKECRAAADFAVEGFNLSLEELAPKVSPLTAKGTVITKPENVMLKNKTKQKTFNINI